MCLLVLKWWEMQRRGVETKAREEEKHPPIVSSIRSLGRMWMAEGERNPQLFSESLKVKLSPVLEAKMPFTQSRFLELTIGP